MFTAAAAAANEPKSRSAAELKQDTKLINLLRSAIDAASDEGGWAHLGGVGSNVTKQAPDFDSRNYGYGKLSDLLKATGLFEIERREQTVLVRDRDTGR